jgi:hypothetical protein
MKQGGYTLNKTGTGNNVFRSNVHLKLIKHALVCEKHRGNVSTAI